MKTLWLVLAMLLMSCSAIPELTQNAPIIDGKQIAFSRNKGNCLACHAIANGESPGNIGPPLKNVASRFSNKQALVEQIWDARHFNPETSMPPFGANRILTSDEISALVDYLWSL